MTSQRFENAIKELKSYLESGGLAQDTTVDKQYETASALMSKVLRIAEEEGLDSDYVKSRIPNDGPRNETLIDMIEQIVPKPNEKGEVDPRIRTIPHVEDVALEIYAELIMKSAFLLGLCLIATMVLPAATMIAMAKVSSGSDRIEKTETGEIKVIGHGDQGVNQGQGGSNNNNNNRKITNHHHSSSSSSSTTISSKHGGLIQIPSNKTDYPDNDPSVIQVHVTSAKKDILGDYEIRGEVTNVRNVTLQFVHITAHVYDATGQLVGSGDGYTTPSDLDTQHTGTYDIFVTKDSLNGKPASYRLSYDWS